MPRSSQQQHEKPRFACPVPVHQGVCALQEVAAHPWADSVEAIGSAVVVHGEITEQTVTSIRDSHPGRHVTLDGDVLVLWP
jgi:hypothetical protein